MSQKDRPRRDLHNDIRLCHLSYILEKFMPCWFFETLYLYVDKHDLKEVENHWPSFVQHVTNHRMQALFVGSRADFLYIPNTIHRQSQENDKTQRFLQHDIDVVIVLHDIVAGYDDNAKFVIDTKYTKPGYFRLHHTKTGGVMRAEFLKLPFKRAIDVMQLIENGPALTPKSFGNRFLDIVATGCCPSWPREAEAWITRHCPSEWPTKEMKEEIASHGCHFVAKAHKLSEQPDIEFRFSFVVAAKKVIGQITTSQRQCYIIFKTLINHCLRNKSFSSYCLKTIFLHALEKIPREIWEDKISGLATCLLHLIDELKHGLIARDIPMYFMPTCNLIERVSNIELRRDIQRICRLRRNLLHEVLEYDYNCGTIGLLSEVLPLSQIFVDYGQIVRVHDQKHIRCMCLYDQLDINYCFFCGFHDNKHALLGTIQVEHSPTFSPIARAIALLARMKDLIHGVEVGSQIQNDIAQTLHVTLMGCFISVWSIIYLNTSILCVLEDYADLIDKAFKNYFPRANVKLHVYYAKFLMFHHRNDEAISVLETAISLDIDKEQDTVMYEYFYLLRNHLDKVLLHLLDQRGELRVPPGCMAYYMLIRLYEASNRIQDAEDLLDDFFEYCECRCTKNGLYDGHLLFGWSCLFIGEYWRAADGFSNYKTTSYTRGYHIASMHICRMAAYIMDNLH